MGPDAGGLERGEDVAGGVSVGRRSSHVGAAGEDVEVVGRRGVGVVAEAVGEEERVIERLTWNEGVKERQGGCGGEEQEGRGGDF